jgi:hypothetical protein
VPWRHMPWMAWIASASAGSIERMIIAVPLGR